MTNVRHLRSLAILLLATMCSSCGSASEKVWTVEEIVPRIDELDGRTVSVAGYLSKCGGYDCTLYRNEEDVEAWRRIMDAIHAKQRVSMPDPPALTIGSGANFDFDAKAARFANRYVVITGTMTNKCRFEGKPACSAIFEPNVGFGSILLKKSLAS